MKKVFTFCVLLALVIFIQAQTNPTLWGTSTAGGSLGNGTIYTVRSDDNNYSVPYNFGTTNQGWAPYGSLLQASNGLLYGLTSMGGPGGGVIFTLNPANNVYTEVYLFSASTGITPYGSLIQATDGKLYGMTWGGGANNDGVIFSFDPTSNTYADLYDFVGMGGTTGSLLQASNGLMYGMTEAGGTGFGSLFSFDPVSHQFIDNLFDFSGDPTESDGTNYGGNPSGSVIQGLDGNLYGVTGGWGVNDLGVIFSYNITTQVYTDLVDFTGTTGSYIGQGPTGLMQTSDGTLYGLCNMGGAGNNGVLFYYTISPAAYGETDFNGTDGVNPASTALVQSTSTGLLYGMCSFGGTDNYGDIFSFDPANHSGGISDQINFDNSSLSTPGLGAGETPYGNSLIQATNGKLYGMTTNGGQFSGNIFAFDPVAVTDVDIIDLLDGYPYTGSVPIGMLQGPNGLLYGVTNAGGISGQGVLFSLDPVKDTFTNVLNLPYLSSPWGQLTLASNGLMYGLTQEGGVNGVGNLFSLDTFGIYTNLYSFSFGSLGNTPLGALVQANNGLLYGTTSTGGTGGAGAIFSFNPNNSAIPPVLLHNFTGGTDGGNPGYGNSLVQASNNLLYGLAENGGANGFGVVYSINLSGSSFNVVWPFDGITGGNPTGSLVQAANGLLYGMTNGDGMGNTGGNLFSIDALGNFGDLVDFTQYGSYGYNPGNITFTPLGVINGSLWLGSDGNLYGATTDGSSGFGELFQYNYSSNLISPISDFTNIGSNEPQEPVGNVIELRSLTDSAAPVGLCAGASVNVPFVATGLYICDNTFTAQLSDASGNFGSAVTIGTLSGTTSGTISATIPGGASGTGYRIRIVSSDPNFTGADNGTDIVIGSSPSTSSVSLAITGGTNPTCSGIPVTFTATPSNGGTTPLYYFEVNGNFSGVSSSPVYTTSSLNNGDVVTVVMNSNVSCPSQATYTSNGITMTVNSCPFSVNITGTGDNTGCGDSLVPYNGYITGTVTGETCGDPIDVSCGCGLPDQFISNGGTFNFTGIQSSFACCFLSGITVTANDDCGDAEASSSPITINDNSQCSFLNVYGPGISSTNNTACTGYNGTITGSIQGGAYTPLDEVVTVSCNGCGAADYSAPLSGSPVGTMVFSFTGVMPGLWDITASDAAPGDIPAYERSGFDQLVTIGNDPDCAGANTWLGNTNDWSLNTNWSSGLAPACSDVNDIIPATGTDPIISSAAFAGNLTIDDGVTLTVNAALSVCGNLTGGSSRVATISGSTALTLTGTTLQTLSGLISFQNQLALDNTLGSAPEAELAAGAAVDIYDALVLQNDNTLDASLGTLTLKSTSVTQAAIIDNFSGSNSGTVTGNITAERFYGSATASNDFKQHMLGSPVSGINLSALGSTSGNSAYYEAATGGIHNCNELLGAPGTPYGNVFTYDETHASTCTMDGWKVGAASTAVSAGTGYSVVLGGGSGTLSLTGPANLSSGYAPSTTNSGYSNTTSDQGRVYTSGINLVSNPYPASLSVSALNAANSSDFSGQTVYVWDVATGQYDMNPATIAPFQAFKVIQSAAGSSTYSIPGTARTTTAGTFQRTTNPVELNMTVTNNNTGLTDNTIVGFNPGSTAQFDPSFDVIKLPGALTRHTMYSLNSNYWLAINVLKSIDETSTVPVGFEPGVSGTYTANFGGLNSFDPTIYIMLEDLQTGTMFNVRSGDYTFSSDATTDSWNRFVLHFTPPASITASNATCSEQGMINIVQPGTAIWNYTLADNNNVTLSSGTLNVNAPVNASVPAGVYTLTLTDNNGYTVVKTIEVNGVQPVIASFTASANSVNVNQEVTLNSTSNSAVVNNWNFGDGTTGNGVTVSHTYVNEGVYNVTLNSTSASGCNSSVSNTITVTRSVTGVTTLNDINNILIWSNEDIVNVDFSQLTNVQANIEIYNLLGQKLSEDKYVTSTVYRKQIPNIEEGYIVVSVKNNDEIISKKLFISNTK